MEFFSNSIFSLFFIIGVGFILGKISIKGFSFDISAILFFSLLMGHYGITLPDEIQMLGLVLFIYTVGIQAGPGFFKSFKKQGRVYFQLALILIGSAVLLTFIIGYAFNIDKSMTVGLLTGALTSTPGLAVAIDATKSPLASIGYGIAYPFGVIGVILFVKFFPSLFRIKISDAEKGLTDSLKKENPEIFVKTFVVQNPHVVGKSLSELKVRRMTGGVVSRIKHNDVTFTPTPTSVLTLGDKLRVVGYASSFDQIRVLIGDEVNEELELSKDYRVQSVLVTSTDVVNKTLRQINLFRVYNATVTRVRRSGIDLAPEPNLKLQLGDKLMVACGKENIKNVTALFGDNDKKLSDTDFLPIAVGIMLGMLAGKISISFSDSFSFSPGLTGGILIIALVLGRVGKTGPVLWSMTGAATQLLRQLGLIFFLAAVGTKAGAILVDTFTSYGFELFAYGAIITLVPMIITSIVGIKYFKMNGLELLGALTGGMTSTPGLAAVEPLSDSDAPKVAYATIYPIAMVLLIVLIQFLL